MDAWGEPLYLHWQQENLALGAIPPGSTALTALAANSWTTAETFIGLSKEHRDVGPTNVAEYSKPVLPTQIRPFLISERLLKIDGLPADYELGHAF